MLQRVLHVCGRDASYASHGALSMQNSQSRCQPGWPTNRVHWRSNSNSNPSPAASHQHNPEVDMHDQRPTPTMYQTTNPTSVISCIHLMHVSPQPIKLPSTMPPACTAPLPHALLHGLASHAMLMHCQHTDATEHLRDCHYKKYNGITTNVSTQEITRSAGECC
jgi:hypothetical protein